MKYEKVIFIITIVLLIIFLSIYSIKFFTLVFNKLGLNFPIKVDNFQYWSPPYCLCIYPFLTVLFLLTFLFRRETNIKTKSAVFAFFISLIYEMFGFGYSLYFVYMILGKTGMPKCHQASFIPHVIRFPVLIITWTVGIFFVAAGWSKIWNSRELLVTDGIYSRLRHPQYLGLCIILFGSFFFFPTPFLLFIFITLLIMYYRLARREEQKLEIKFGSSYREYKRRVPMW